MNVDVANTNVVDLSNIRIYFWCIAIYFSSWILAWLIHILKGPERATHESLHLFSNLINSFQSEKFKSRCVVHRKNKTRKYSMWIVIGRSPRIQHNHIATVKIFFMHWFVIMRQSTVHQAEILFQNRMQHRMLVAKFVRRKKWCFARVQCLLKKKNCYRRITLETQKHWNISFAQKEIYIFCRNGKSIG